MQKRLRNSSPLRPGYFLPSLIAVVFKTEYDLMISDINNSMICNCHPVYILAKVTYDIFNFPQRWFAVNNPWFIPCSFNLIPVIRKKLYSREILLHSVHEPSPELKTQPGDRVQVFALFYRYVSFCP